MGQPKCIYIEWYDIVVEDAGWQDIEGLEPLEAELCKSIGFLLEVTDFHVTLTPTSAPGAINTRITIPKGVIKQVHTIKIGPQVDVLSL